MSKQFRKRNRPGRNLHHLVNKRYGGADTRQNLLLIDIERHQAWHKLFGNMNAKEALRLLARVVRAKANHGRQYAGNPAVASVEILLETKEET